MDKNPVSCLNTEIKKRFGNVKRSRGIYLYTEKGIRLTDCYLSAGRAILGYGGGKAQTAFKDVFERGANCFYDSGFWTKLENSVKKLLPPNYCVRLYSDESIAAAKLLSSFNCADSFGGSGVSGDNQHNEHYREIVDNSEIRDSRENGDFLQIAEENPLTTEASKVTDTSRERNTMFHKLSTEASKVTDTPLSAANSQKPKDFSVALWRPWLDFCGKYEEVKPGKQAQYSKVKIFFPDYSENQATPPIICLVPPFAYSTSLKFYAFRNDLFNAKDLPENDAAPAPLLAAFTRGIYDLIGALAKYGENDFKQNMAFLSKVFERKACYLFSKLDQSTYSEFVLKCLDIGIVFSPDCREPSIVPWKANIGDLKKLKKVVEREWKYE